MSSIWETPFFQGITPTPIHVADWRKQLRLWQEENDRAERPQDEITWEHHERLDSETQRSFTYRVVYEYVEASPATCCSAATYKLVPTAVYIPVSEDDQIVYLTEGEGDVVDQYRRAKERARGESEQKKGIRYRKNRMQSKSDKAEKFDINIATSGASDEDIAEIEQMVNRHAPSKKNE